MKYQIMASVSGGVTGYRSAPLKSNGVVRVFETEAEAQTVADDLNTRQNSYPNNRYGASYSYTVYEVDDVDEFIDSLPF